LTHTLVHEMLLKEIDDMIIKSKSWEGYVLLLEDFSKDYKNTSRTKVKMN